MPLGRAEGNVVQDVVTSCATCCTSEQRKALGDKLELLAQRSVIRPDMARKLEQALLDPGPESAAPPVAPPAPSLAASPAAPPATPPAADTEQASDRSRDGPDRNDGRALMLWPVHAAHCTATERAGTDWRVVEHTQRLVRTRLCVPLTGCPLLTVPSGVHVRGVFVRPPAAVAERRLGGAYPLPSVFHDALHAGA